MRLKYNYELIILSHNLGKSFHYYCLKHRKIKSKKRLARNFLLSNGFSVQDFKRFQNSFIALDRMVEIAKVKWVNE